MLYQPRGKVQLWGIEQGWAPMEKQPASRIFLLGAIVRTSLMLKLCVVDVGGIMCLCMDAFVVSAELERTFETPARFGTKPVCADGWKRVPLYAAYQYLSQVEGRFGMLLQCFMNISGSTLDELSPKLDLMGLKVTDMAIYDIVSKCFRAHLEDSVNVKDTTILRSHASVPFLMARTAIPNLAPHMSVCKLSPSTSSALLSAHASAPIPASRISLPNLVSPEVDQLWSALAPTSSVSLSRSPSSSPSQPQPTPSPLAPTSFSPLSRSPFSIPFHPQPATSLLAPTPSSPLGRLPSSPSCLAPYPPAPHRHSMQYQSSNPKSTGSFLSDKARAEAHPSGFPQLISFPKPGRAASSKSVDLESRTLSQAEYTGPGIPLGRTFRSMSQVPDYGRSTWTGTGA